MVRHAQDDHTATTVQSTAEHAVLAMVTAARAGARVPEPVLAYPVAAGRGTRGALLAWVDVGDRPWTASNLKSSQMLPWRICGTASASSITTGSPTANCERTTSSSTTTTNRG